ncbi:hypothetical protein HPB49_004272 [Dermacentor silvarum]|uniref:Uncharacterized protein n=1 Tax=Dermacentor silvarum TaxID=543639 RepID=A0ACB8CVC9_DERSI|nr:hypothetical protein HPB49_004272 [Dermacentor silvarum]
MWPRTWKASESGCYSRSVNSNRVRVAHALTAPRFFRSSSEFAMAMSAVVRTIHQMRLVCQQLAQRMVREGRLPSADLLFFLTFEEIGLLLNSRAAELVLRAQRRQRIYAEIDKDTYPSVFVGIPKPKGEILVTTATDTGWTPYFPLLAGVVTEIGGPLSHGAVVAREYGLPCIVGIEGITTMIATGDFLQLDGNTGVLRKISLPPIHDD